jgi:hypothetical protein
VSVVVCNVSEVLWIDFRPVFRVFCDRNTHRGLHWYVVCHGRAGVISSWDADLNPMAVVRSDGKMRPVLVSLAAVFQF